MTDTTDEPTRSAHDLLFEIAQDRIAGLRASADPPTGRADATPGHRLDRWRDAIGRRLIGLGGALAVDEGLRRRALRP